MGAKIVLVLSPFYHLSFHGVLIAPMVDAKCAPATCCGDVRDLSVFFLTYSPTFCKGHMPYGRKVSFYTL